MSAHARDTWTVPQMSIAAACSVIGVTVAILGFIDIYLTVTHLLSTSWGSWSWTVIVLGEGSGIGSYLGWLLLELRDDPPRRLRVFVAGYLALFGVGSLVLNLAASHGLAGIASHVIVVVAFFGYLVFAKVLVKRLSATRGERALEQALADARQHAIDLCRDRKGARWRWRVPSLLRRQILTGRLPDEVRSAITLKVSVGQTSGWESTVRAWVSRELRIDLLAEVAERDAVAAIQQVPAEALPAAVPAGPVATPAATPLEAPPAPALEAPPEASRKPSATALQRVRRAGRKATDELLLEAIAEMASEGASVTKTRLVRDLPVGEPRAARLMEAWDARLHPKPHLHVAAEG